MLKGVLITYVDDMLVAGKKSIASPVMNAIRRKWLCSEGEYSWQGQKIILCGLCITRYPGGSYFLDQDAYTVDVVGRHKMMGSSGLKQPLPSDEGITKDPKELSTIFR